jgi:uncharacterized linocin/CFP29 family protein
MSENNALFSAWLASGGAIDLGAMRPYLNKNRMPVATIGGKQRMVQNALLRKDEWQQIDSAVLDVVRLPNVAINDFLSRGLTQPLDGLGVTISSYEQLSDMNPAELNMNGEVQGENDKVEFTPQNIPVPLIFKDFNIALRTLEASRRNSNGGAPANLDTTQATVATRRVQDRIDDMIFNGETKQLGGNIIYGLTNKPQRIQKTSAQCGGGDWGTSGNAYKTLNGAIGFLQAAGYVGPFGAYIAREQYSQVNALITNTAVSELSAIVAQIPNLAFLKPADKLTAGEMIVWQMTKDVADLGIAQDVTTVQWETLGGFIVKFRVFTAITVRVKHDANAKCGIIHVTGN